MSKECIFCRIVRKEIKSEILFEDDHVVAFRDINPRAPVHILVIPKKHIPTVNDIEEEDLQLLGKMVGVARDLAVTSGISESGYRLVINCHQNAGQEVYHLHLHLLGGRKMKWPPG
ncbi:MAG: histidine triad nucleotide-binding protein [Candidatus Neomarinimicrobiota bacterium]|nr:histidine triad nucleotide-binding protein [Candidatus Neomarinimicrobiota bacterium]RKY50739.1 MAG: histidine triad nucleotide-binding protein [Candidatus Neomarinimicrobiota bacterium]